MPIIFTIKINYEYLIAFAFEHFHNIFLNYLPTLCVGTKLNLWVDTL